MWCNGNVDIVFIVCASDIYCWWEFEFLHVCCFQLMAIVITVIYTILHLSLGLICGPILLFWTFIRGDLEMTLNFPHLYSPGFQVLDHNLRFLYFFLILFSFNRIELRWCQVVWCQFMGSCWGLWYTDTCSCLAYLCQTNTSLVSVLDAAPILLAYMFIISYLLSPSFHIVLSFFLLFNLKMLDGNVNNDNFINSEMF